MTLEDHPANLTDQLLSLRDYYQAQLATYERKAIHLREQLNHINALLVDQLVTTDDEPSEPVELLDAGTALLALQGNEEALPPEPEVVLESREEPESSPVVASLEPAEPTKPAKTNVAGSSLALFAPYQGMTKIQAVHQLLKDHHDTPLTVDEIIRQLYGDLDKSDLVLERERMRNTILRGKKQNLWQRASGKETRFTVSLVQEASAKTNGQKSKSAKSPEKNLPRSAAKVTPVAKATPTDKKELKASQPTPVQGKAAKPKPAKSAKSTVEKTSSPPSTKQTTQPSAGIEAKLEMQPAYASKSLTEAVRKVMKAHQGQVMTSRLVATALYPTLDEMTFDALKQPINLIFSKGYSQGKWDRVPNQKGAYILK